MLKYTVVSALCLALTPSTYSVSSAITYAMATNAVAQGQKNEKEIKEISERVDKIEKDFKEIAEGIARIEKQLNIK
jgi:peptidoglycan hydrolase CwlO-like protein